MVDGHPELAEHNSYHHDRGEMVIDPRIERRLLLKLDALILPLTALLYLSALFVRFTSPLTAALTAVTPVTPSFKACLTSLAMTPTTSSRSCSCLSTSPTLCVPTCG